MTVQRWTTTTAVMAAVGLGLWVAAPGPGALAAAVRDPQRLVDTQGPDALVVLLAWALAAACWSWGAVGLLLTVAGAAPGVGGALARALLTVLLPAGLRRAAALAVGLSLVAAPAVVLGSPGGLPTTSTSTAALGTAAPDTAPLGPAALDAAAPDTAGQGTPALQKSAPAAATWSDVGSDPAPPVPDWPAPVAAGDHVVVRGDCLWDVAAAWLAERGPATDAQVQAAVEAWWQANAAVIGPDPDLLLPGQVLHAPPAP